MILTHTQAHAVYNALCSLDAVGVVADRLEIRNMSASVDIHCSHKGALTLRDNATDASEYYADWSAFILAYNLY